MLICEKDCLKDFARLPKKMAVDDLSILENFRLTVK